MFLSSLLFASLIVVAYNVTPANCAGYKTNFTKADYDKAEPPEIGVSVQWNMQLMGIEEINEAEAVRLTSDCLITQLTIL